MSNQKKSTPSLTETIRTKLNSYDTVSGKIRYLASQSFDRGDISRILTKELGTEVRYQWVRNVLITPVKSAK